MPPRPKSSPGHLSQLPPPGDRKRRLLALARAIADGSYTMDARRIAQRMLAGGALQ